MPNPDIPSLLRSGEDITKCGDYPSGNFVKVERYSYTPQGNSTIHAVRKTALEPKNYGIVIQEYELLGELTTNPQIAPFIPERLGLKIPEKTPAGDYLYEPAAWYTDYCTEDGWQSLEKVRPSNPQSLRLIKAKIEAFVSALSLIDLCLDYKLDSFVWREVNGDIEIKCLDWNTLNEFRNNKTYKERYPMLFPRGTVDPEDIVRFPDDFLSELNSLEPTKLVIDVPPIPPETPQPGNPITLLMETYEIPHDTATILHNIMQELENIVEDPTILQNIISQLCIFATDKQTPNLTDMEKKVIELCTEKGFSY